MKTEFDQKLPHRQRFGTTEKCSGFFITQSTTRHSPIVPTENKREAPLYPETTAVRCQFFLQSQKACALPSAGGQLDGPKGRQPHVVNGAHGVKF